jgi:hypothetical protein
MFGPCAAACAYPPAVDDDDATATGYVFASRQILPERGLNYGLLTSYHICVFLTAGFRVFSLQELLSSEFIANGNEVVPLYRDAGARGDTSEVRLILHRVLPDENAIEASLVVRWFYSRLPKELQGRDRCMEIVFGNRMDPVFYSPEGTLIVDCRQQPETSNYRVYAERREHLGGAADRVIVGDRFFEPSRRRR